MGDILSHMIEKSVTWTDRQMNSELPGSVSKADDYVPAGFKYSPDVLKDYDEQLCIAIENEKYQQTQVPSMDAVPPLDIVPKFNPVNAPEEAIYGRDRIPKLLRDWGLATHAELTGSEDPVEMWRIVDKATLEDGSGLVAGSIMRDTSLGDVESFDPVDHLISNHERRINGKSTPFVSFSTDPEYLAGRYILHHGFGVRGDRDAVVVRVIVDPDRVITFGQNKEEETLLIGGVAPSEFIAAYAIPDFVASMSPDIDKDTI